MTENQKLINNLATLTRLNKLHWIEENTTFTLDSRDLCCNISDCNIAIRVVIKDNAAYMVQYMSIKRQSELGFMLRLPQKEDLSFIEELEKELNVYFWKAPKEAPNSEDLVKYINDKLDLLRLKYHFG